MVSELPSGALNYFMRIAIIGWPRTGKTTLGLKMADELGLPYRSTDETLAMNLDWSAASEHVSTWLDEPEWVIEGVALPRALRKWRERNNTEPPVDRIIYLRTPHEELKTGQIAMGKGLDTVMGELHGWLPMVEYL